MALRLIKKSLDDAKMLPNSHRWAKAANNPLISSKYRARLCVH